MIDWRRVDELRDEIGADDFEEIVEIFLEEVEEIITVIKEGAPAASLEDHLHFLKGSAMNVGLSQFSNLCLAGEMAAQRGEYSDIDLGGIVLSYESSKKVFLETLAKRSAA